MVTKDSEKKQWTDPKDYGLPFVEITPIRTSSIPLEDASVSPGFEVEAESFFSESDSSIGKQKSEEKDKPVEVPVAKEEKSETLKSTSSITAQTKQKSNWAWVVLLFGLSIVSFIVWQILSQTNESGTNSPIVKTDEPAEIEASSIQKEDSGIKLLNQDQVIENQDTIAINNNSAPIIAETTETGTTIDNTASGNLIRIESQAERPQYFIIVGSLPTEALAIAEADQYIDRSAQIFLISPMEGTRNYRIALSRFENFGQASAELEQIKSQYTEELWILKY